MRVNLYIVFSIALLLLSCKSKTQMDVDLTPVQNFELDRYLGTWYEIARFPHRFEKDLVGVTATYSMRPDGKVKVENAGYVDSLNGKYKSITGKAKLAGDADVGYLRVSFFLFFYSDYKIIALDKENYQYAMVGSSENYLWILSRSPQMDEKTYTMLVEKARERGYDVSKLSKVLQKPLAKYKEGSQI